MSDIAQYPKWPLCGHGDANSQLANSESVLLNARTNQFLKKMSSCQELVWTAVFFGWTSIPSRDLEDMHDFSSLLKDQLFFLATFHRIKGWLEMAGYTVVVVLGWVGRFMGDGVHECVCMREVC